MDTDGLSAALWKHMFSWIGLPHIILGDRDTRLTAKKMRSVCQYLGTRLIRSTAYHPQTDGQTENFNRIPITAPNL
jgi:transposase InsO family protein